MMNHHLPAGPHMNATHQQPSRRQQEYHNSHNHPHNHFHGAMAHSPGPMHNHNHNHNPYAAHYGHGAYYSHPAAHMAYAAAPRWQQQPFVPAYPMPPPQYPPRSPMSPMIVSSHMAPQPPPMTPVTRHAPLPYMPPPPPEQSPAPVAHTPLTPASTVYNSFPSPPRPDSVQSSNPPAPTSRRSSSVVAPYSSSPPPPSRRFPFYPPLPWLSRPDETFPAKALKRRRKRQELLQQNDSVALPSREFVDSAPDTTDPAPSNTDPIAAESTQDQNTPATPRVVPSEAEFAPAPVSPVVDQDGSKMAPPQTETPPQTRARRNTRTAMPIIPVVPNIPSTRPKTSSPGAPATPPAPADAPSAQAPAASSKTDDASSAPESAPVASPPKPAAPKSWADLVRAKNAGAAAASAVVNGAATSNGNSTSRAGSVAEALKQYNVDQDEKIAFLEPRGLVNTGNMCYMNSILQILVFCTPFYNFLDQVSKRAAHSFKSDTPLVDAMIMFMREFKILDSAESSEKLRMRLKQDELEHFGEPIIPEYVYDVIKRLPRFSSMTRGHQQDAEEFLGFLLAGMHDECAAIIRAQSEATSADQTKSPSADSPSTDNGWLEVGPKQKAAITRESGDLNSSPSPVTRIFGGQLRSELRVPGQKNSVTLEPYQPLQLDIGAPQINNITDALRAITKPETITGVGSRDGKAVKQVFIESLPPILILHLKRFQYDNTGGTQKIWKKVGYPLQLEIPKEVFAPAKRGAMGISGEPKYRLISVVYHHGKSAAGGHYTVDILRQDEREWARIDDTVIRRIRAEDVAEGGSEEDPRTLARALEQHANDQPGSKRNLFEGLDGNGDDDAASVQSWNEVNGSGGVAKKWSSAAAGQDKKDKSSGRSTPASAKVGSGVRDNKVAYILLYERIKG